jgi:hypothetical protein
VLGVALTVACAAGALLALVAARDAPAGDPGEVWWWPFELFVWLPTTWPMMLVIVVALASLDPRPQKSRAPRS